MYYICKKLTFESSHRLWNNDLTETENINIFDKCSNYPSHGHSYKLYITLKSENLINGMVINFSDIKKIATEKIIDKFDHHYINDLLPNNMIATAENMCKFFYDVLKIDFPMLYSIKLYETETAWVEYMEEKLND